MSNKSKTKSIVDSYLTFSPKKMKDNLQQSAVNVIEPIQDRIRKDINLFNYISGAGYDGPAYTFEEQYQLNGWNENMLQSSFTRKAWHSLFFMVMTITVMILGIRFSLAQKDLFHMITSSSGYIGAFAVFFALYFSNTVKAHCIKTRSFGFKHKLKAFTKIDSIFPNPLEDVRLVVNEKDSNLVAILETKEEQKRYLNKKN